MLLMLLFAFGLICVTVGIHALGTLHVITHLAQTWEKKAAHLGRFARGLQIVRVVSALLLLHLLEAVAWGGLYWMAGILPDSENAIYFSLTSYTTVGYGDVVLPAPWRLLGPIEAGVGILMFGWSTGIMVAAISKIYGDHLILLSGQQSEENEPKSTRDE